MWFVFGCSAYLDPAAGAAEKASLASLFQTGWFVESLLTQTLIVHIIRTKRIPFFGSRASLHMTLTTLVVMAIGAWLPYSPFAPDLGMVPLPAGLLGLDRGLPGELRRADPRGEDLVLQAVRG